MSVKDKREDFSWVGDFRREHLKKSARNPGLAALMSFILMGSGQIYAGHIDRGIILLFIHLFALFAGYSLYTGGFVYEWLMSMIGPHFIIVICYILSVIFILTWIFNIKDAYYLSIFSSFRDWFEVERVLLPSMGVPADMLLSNNNNSMNLLENNSPYENNEELSSKSENIKVSNNVSIVKTVEDTKDKEEEIINITAEKTTEDNSVIEEKSFDESAADLVFMNSNTWRTFASLVLVIVLLGIGIGFYYNKDYEDTSFQVSNSIETSSYKKVLETAKLENPPIKENTKEESKQAVKTAEALLPTSESKQSTTLTQEQVEAYVDQRIRSLLALKNKVDESWQKISSGNRFLSNSDNVPVIVSADVSDENDRTDSSTDSFDGNIENKADYSNQVVVIQGHKEAKILNRSSNLYDSEGGKRGVVLYEAPDGEDDVELVMTEEGNTNHGFSSEPSSGIRNEFPLVNEVAQNHVVPNVSQKTIDSLKEDNKTEDKEKTQNLIQKEEEPKGKVLFDRSDEVEEKRITPYAAEEKPVVLEPQIIKNKVKHTENNINFESPELRAKLEKIKERGAHEFYNGNWEAALPFYFEVLKYRRNAESFEMVGIIFEKMNKLNDAFEAYENAYTLGLDTNHNVSRLGLIAEKIGKYDKAQKYLEKAIENNPKRADIILSYARCLNKQGEGLAAAQVLAVLRDSTNSYAIKKAAEQEYQKILELESKNNQNNQDEKIETEISIK